MNILLITNRYPKSPDDPASPFVPDFVHALRSAGARVIVQTPLYGKSPVEDDPDVYRFRFGQKNSEEPIGSWNIFKPRNWWRMYRFVESGEKTIDELIQRHRIDHILALWALPSGWFAHYAARKWNVPYSVWSLGSDIHSWARRPLFGRLTKEILSDAKHIYADGFALAKAASRLSGKACRFLPSCRRLGDKVLSAKIKDLDHPYFLYTGRLHRDKGIFDLLVAFHRAMSDLPDTDLVYVGDGPELNKLKLMARDREFRGRVKIVGKVPASALAAYYRDARATVIPSRADSLPLVFSEAVQCGSPLIVYDTGDLGHFVRRFNLGKVVQTGDIRSLSRALVDISAVSRHESAGGAVVLDMLHPVRAARKFLHAVIQSAGTESPAKNKNARVRFRPDRGG